MPNWCSTAYVIDGDAKEVKQLYELMKGLEERKTPSVENGFGTTWLGCLVDALGKDWNDVRCRGSWNGLEMDGSLFGPEPGKFLILMLIAGVVCGWMGAALWNAMSERLPTALAGQLIVFETIFSVIYAHIWRGQWPTVSMVIGMVMLLLGVLAAMRVFRQSRVQS